jgi:hypothetical protein
MPPEIEYSFPGSFGGLKFFKKLRISKMAIGNQPKGIRGRKPSQVPRHNGNGETPVRVARLSDSALGLGAVVTKRVGKAGDGLRKPVLEYFAPIKHLPPPILGRDIQRRGMVVRVICYGKAGVNLAKFRPGKPENFFKSPIRQ